MELNKCHPPSCDCWNNILSLLFRPRLHQASASTVRQLYNDASDTVLIENNRVTPEWVTTHFQTTSLLPPANKVCGKVMFLHVSVILSTGGVGSMRDKGACVAGRGVHGGGGCACPCHACPLPHTPNCHAVNERAIRILLDCILVFNENPITGIITELWQRWPWRLV